MNVRRIEDVQQLVKQGYTHAVCDSKREPGKVLSRHRSYSRAELSARKGLDRVVVYLPVTLRGFVINRRFHND